MLTFHIHTAKYLWSYFSFLYILESHLFSDFEIRLYHCLKITLEVNWHIIYGERKVKTQIQTAFIVMEINAKIQKSKENQGNKCEEPRESKLCFSQNMILTLHLFSSLVIFITMTVLLNSLYLLLWFALGKCPPFRTVYRLVKFCKTLTPGTCQPYAY